MKIINLGILAHVDAGKTTVTEGLLVHSGVKKRMGRVDDGTTTTDSMTLERQRGMTIRAATVSFPWRGVKINLIDTPGHMDFIAEVERSLTVLDGVVLVISAREGVQPQTRVIFHKLRAMGIPTILFVNKIDRTGVSLEAVYADIRKHLSDRLAPMQHAEEVGTREVRAIPLDETEGPLCEAIVEQDDALLARYIEGKAIAPAEIRDALRGQVRACTLFPVYLGAALQDIGIAPLLDAVAQWLPGASGDTDAPLSAYVYKLEWASRDHKWAYVRVLDGVLAVRERVNLVGQEEPVMVRGLMTPQGGGFAHVGSVEAGDIGVLLDAPFVRCGDFLGNPVPLKQGGSTAEPLLSVGIAPAVQGERFALLQALQRLTEEDPLLRLSIREATEEISLRLYGVLQREILEALLLERFGLKAVFSPMRTLYKEQPKSGAFAEMRIWTEGNQHAAGIALEIEPLPLGSGIVYERKVSYGDLEKMYQNGVEEGVRLGLREGLGQEIIDARVTFVDMDYSSVTSTPADYRRLAPLVVKKALASVPLRRLEPWLSFTLSAPLDTHKRVLAALSQVHAILLDVTHGEEEFTVRGEAPLDTTKLFPAELLSMTQGKGLFDAGFLEYREVKSEKGDNG